MKLAQPRKNINASADAAAGCETGARTSIHIRLSYPSETLRVLCTFQSEGGSKAYNS
jgi:hypothetical protein